MSVKPLGDRILIRSTVVVEEMTKGGLYLARETIEAEKMKVIEAQIVAISEEVIEPKYKVGDVIVYDKYAGTKYEIKGVEHIILNCNDVLAVINQ